MTTTDKRGLLATLGVGALLILCCAAPVLIAAGTLGALGGILSSPWLLAAGGALLLAALVATVLQVRGHSRSAGTSRSSDEDSCPPPHRRQR